MIDNPEEPEDDEEDPELADRLDDVLSAVDDALKAVKAGRTQDAQRILQLILDEEAE